MLIDKLIPYEKAVRALYAAAFGDEAAADDERINADGMSGLIPQIALKRLSQNTLVLKNLKLQKAPASMMI